MFMLQKLTRLFVIISFLCLIGITSAQAESEKNSQGMYPGGGQSGNGSMGATHPMFNPAMWMNPNVMMNPGNYMSLMNPNVMMNPGNYMQMMDPNAYMSMMNPMSMMGPMMGMMGPMMGMGGMSSMMNPMSMMGPMMGMGGMSSMMNPMGMMGGMGGMGGTGNYGGNNNSTGQMMDPKQYEDWYKQWTEAMQKMAPQNKTAQ